MLPLALLGLFDPDLLPAFLLKEVVEISRFLRTGLFLTLVLVGIPVFGLNLFAAGAASLLTAGVG